MKQRAVSLHHDASASSLGLARVLVFSIWFWQLAVDPIERLADLSTSAFAPPGVLRVVPGGIWDLILEPSVLLAFKAGLLMALLLVILGATRSRVLLGLTVSGLVLYQGVVRGFSGHMNHAELALLYISMLFVFFPVFDGLTIRTLRVIRWKPAGTDRATAGHAPYVTALLVACLLLSLTYFFVGAVRLWKGIHLFGTPALRDLIAGFSLQDGQFDGSAIIPLGVPSAALSLPLWALQVAFIAATMLELSAPLAVFSRRLRPLIVISLVVFHVSIWAFMNVPFPENMCLLVLLSGSWFNRIAARLDQATPDPWSAISRPSHAHSTEEPVSSHRLAPAEPDSS